MSQKQKHKKLKRTSQQYEVLIDEVAKIDPKAAKYMKLHAWKMNSFEPEGKLSHCFVWDRTRQGHDYWSSIDTLLPEAFSYGHNFGL